MNSSSVEGTQAESLLFVDDVQIAHQQGLVRKAHACRKLDRPILLAEKPWEATGNDRRVYIYGIVLPDPATGGFRMWYNRLNQALYATSKDGIRWHKPSLGLVEFEGSRENNILPLSFHSPSFILDPGADPSERYKAIGAGKSDGRHGYYAAYSADGFHWSLYSEKHILTGGDTCTLAQDPKTGEHLAFHKKNVDLRGYKRRLVYLSTSRDMRNWSEPELAMAPDEIDDRQTLAEGGLCSQFYNMSAFPYGGQWLGLVTHFRNLRRLESSTPGQSRDDGPIDVQLTHSRDGRNWHRLEDRSPVIPNGPFDYDRGCILGTASQPVICGDEIWIYYTAINTTHGGSMPEKEVHIARAAWRLDGWVSLKAGPEGGLLETVPLDAGGQQLLINADASRGELKVEALDEAGKTLLGYGIKENMALHGDVIRHPVRWKGHDRLPADRKLRLRITLKNADLYSLRLT